MAKKRANGENSIYYSESRKQWIGQITLGYDENGKRKRKSVYGKTKTEVNKKLKQIEVGVYVGDFIDKSNITIYQLAKQILDDELNDGAIKENTYRTNMDTLKRLKAIYNTPLQKATEMQIKDFLLNEQNYSQSIIDKDYTLLKRVFKEAIKKELVKKSPMEDMRKPKSKKKTVKVRALTVDEQNKMIDMLSNNDIRYSRQMLLSMFTGMRMGEINALKVNDINFPFNSISVKRTVSRDVKGWAMLGEDTKTRAGIRYIKFDNNVKRLLKECVNVAGDNELLFTKNNDGKTIISTSMVNEVLTRALKKYDIIDRSIEGKITDHSFRHTYATRCIEAGMQPNVLQKQLGHSDISITLNTYCDVFDKYQDQNIDLVSNYLKSNNLTLSA